MRERDARRGREREREHERTAVDSGGATTSGRGGGGDYRWWGRQVGSGVGVMELGKKGCGKIFEGGIIWFFP